jgi:hypothetical protein
METILKELIGNIFDLMLEPETDGICITTNGMVGADNKAIMGAGTAGHCARLFPSVRLTLGKSILEYGNFPFIIGYLDKNNIFKDPDFQVIENAEHHCLIWSFPTKNDFRKKSDLELIKTSAKCMMENAMTFKLKNVYIPLPGCGAKTGQLSWENEVKPAIKDILDDRFTIVALDFNNP